MNRLEEMDVFDRRTHENKSGYLSLSHSSQQEENKKPEEKGCAVRKIVVSNPEHTTIVQDPKSRNPGIQESPPFVVMQKDISKVFPSVPC